MSVLEYGLKTSASSWFSFEYRTKHAPFAAELSHTQTQGISILDLQQPYNHHIP
jgi:hypothetical protein